MQLNSSGYLHHFLRKEVTELYWSASIRKFGISMLAIFTTIYLYNLGFTLTQIALWHVVVYAVYAASIFFSAKVISYVGFELAMAISIPIAIVAYFGYLMLPIYSWLFYLIAVTWGFYKSFYWVPYHSDFARFGNHKNIGKEIGLMVVIIALIETLTPLFSGFIIDWVGISWLFIAASFIMAISATPMLVTRERLTMQPFELKKFFELVKGKWRKDILPLLGFGEEMVGQVVWPIFIFTAIGSYKAVGILTTAVVLFSMVTFLWVGKAADKQSKGKMVRRTSWPVVFSWIGRALAINWWAIILFDSFFKISHRSLSVPLTGIFYNRPAHHKEVVYYVVFRELMLCLGKIFVGLLLALLFVYTDKIQIAFILAVIFTFFYMLWHEHLVVKK